VLFLSPVVFKLTREYFAEETGDGELISQKSD